MVTITNGTIPLLHEFFENADCECTNRNQFLQNAAIQDKIGMVGWLKHQNGLNESCTLGTAQKLPQLFGLFDVKRGAFGRTL